MAVFVRNPATTELARRPTMSFQVMVEALLLRTVQLLFAKRT